MKILIPKRFASLGLIHPYLPRVIWPNLDEKMERVCEERR